MKNKDTALLVEAYENVKEINFEKNIIDHTRALLIFLTYSLQDPVVRDYLKLFALKDKNLNLTPEEENELRNYQTEVDRIIRSTGHSQSVAAARLTDQQRVRYIELLRKRDNVQNSEYVVPEKDRAFARIKLINRLTKFAKDTELKEDIEDIVDYMILFLANNPEVFDILNLANNVEDNISANIPQQENGLGSISINTVPTILQTAIKLLKTGNTGSQNNIFKSVVKLLKNLNPKKALALIQGYRVKPLQLKDKENKENNWEIETETGGWEPLQLTDKE